MSSNSNSDKVISFADFKAKRDIQEQVAHGRNPLFISHLEGKVKGSPHFDKPKAEDYGDRIQRIRTSLEKINRLMTELKKISKEEEGKSAKTSNVSSISRI